MAPVVACAHRWRVNLCPIHLGVMQGCSDCDKAPLRCDLCKTRPLHEVPTGGRFRAGLTKREGKVLRKGEGSIKVRWARGRTDTFNTSEGERVSIPRQPIEFIGPTTEVVWPVPPNGGTP
jgi:hypothetical protein